MYRNEKPHFLPSEYLVSMKKCTKHARERYRKTHRHTDKRKNVEVRLFSACVMYQT